LKSFSNAVQLLQKRMALFKRHNKAKRDEIKEGRRKTL
jgi:hypothetical protein